jgi:FixJ family two-component response regulator
MVAPPRACPPGRRLMVPPAALPEEHVVLVVDDEPTVAQQLAEGLEASGFRVQVAGQAAEALDLVRRSPEIAVVMSDIRMPGGDGLQLARDIQAGRPESQAIEVIVITGHATIDDAAAAVRSRVSDFLRKPFRLQTAVKAVQQAMGQALERRARHEERQRISRQLLEDAARRDELDRRLAALTEALATTGGDGNTSAAVQDRLHAVSHALRTPLNAISASAQLLHEGAPAAHTEDYQRILQEGISEASRAVQLVEELILAEGRPQGAAAAARLAPLLDTAVARAARARPTHRFEPPAIRQDLSVLAPRDPLTRALDLAIEAALDWRPPAKPASDTGLPGAMALRCDLARAEQGGRAWACITLVHGRGGDAADAIPPGHSLEAQGTRLSRTLETLGFLVARRLLERQGGRLTSMITPSGQAVLRLALPLPPTASPPPA